MKTLRHLGGTALLALMLAVPIGTPVDARAEPTLEARELDLAHALRCVVCQNQTVAESNAPLAADMRREIRAQLQAGRSDADIIGFFEARYGAFVHYTPPFRPSTWLLWALPFAGGLAGVLFLLVQLRRRTAAAPGPLTAAERVRARQLLDEEVLR